MRTAAIILAALATFTGCGTQEDDGPTMRLPRSCTVTYVELAAHVDCEFD